MFVPWPRGASFSFETLFMYFSLFKSVSLNNKQIAKAGITKKKK